MATILAIESSCDDTSVAILENANLISHVISSQLIHAEHGGVIPEVASREHQKNIIPVVQNCLDKGNKTLQDLDVIAFTQGPGLLGSLLVGISFAKGLALGLDLPLIGINHMEGHVLSNFLDSPYPKFPFICLTVSGGHTQLVYVKSPLDMKVIGTTRDDAVGEAFDKAAKILGLPYPGGVLIDKYAQKGNPKAFSFPKPKIDKLDFSFSGLKTAFLYFIQKQNQKQGAHFVQENLADICASFQNCLIEVLMNKLDKAVEEYHVSHIAIAGGVAANSLLRKKVQEYAERKAYKFYIPKQIYCTDNAAMIAQAAYYKYEQGLFSPITVSAFPNGA